MVENPGETREQKDRREQVLRLIHGADGSKRYTQDTPILPDVWLAYAREPGGRVSLLLTPFRGESPGRLAEQVRRRLGSEERARDVLGAARIAYNGSVVVADLTLAELLMHVLPLSRWWPARAFGEPTPQAPKRGEHRAFAQARWLAGMYEAIISNSVPDAAGRIPPSFDSLVARAMETKPGNLLWLVSRNRKGTTALQESVRSVKADAARQVFNIQCREITWAVIDTGIDARHPAFASKDRSGARIVRTGIKGGQKRLGPTRVVTTYDFAGFRDMVTVDGCTEGETEETPRLWEIDSNTVTDLRLRLLTGKDIDWSQYGRLLQVPYDGTYPVPEDPHGTHVAGILGGCYSDGEYPDGPIQGVCPDIRLIDLRVFGEDGTADEFSILAALQFVRHLNSRGLETVVHGVNLSLSVPHDVTNFACGRTPVCDECRRLIGEGIVVVAAAGNKGYGQFLSPDGSASGYSDISITDPGNAEDVITVGSTHRTSPHSYGVSYFSSRGPTGDGRTKPDLVAPGEKILGPVAGGGSEVMDGTSMATPHVSGAAALLMAARREFVGEPAAVKRILCRTATDLGREKYFQGHGMVDILRAIQSV